MEVLVLNGRRYVKASKAARELGYTSDYVGQLCRTKQIDAQLVGRTWYVNQDELSTHRVEKKRISRQKAKEQAHRAIAEHRSLSVEQASRKSAHVRIRYEGDDAELIPTVKKLSVTSERPKTRTKPEYDPLPQDLEPKYTIENEGKKILMKGALTVVDASEEVEDSDAIKLTPKIVRRRAQPQAFKKNGAERKLTVSSTENITRKKDFFDRLEDREVDAGVVAVMNTGEVGNTTRKVAGGQMQRSTVDEVEGSEDVETALLSEVSEQKTTRRGVTHTATLITVLITVGAVFFALCTAQVIVIDATTYTGVEKQYRVDIRDTVHALNIEIYSYLGQTR